MRRPRPSSPPTDRGHDDEQEDDDRCRIGRRVAGPSPLNDASDHFSGQDSSGIPGTNRTSLRAPTSPESIPDYFRRWLEDDGYPFWSFWENVRSWWAVRDLPNVKLVHFNEMKKDLPGSIRAIAAFLDIPIDEAKFPAIVEHCSFDYMKSHAEEVSPLGAYVRNGSYQLVRQRPGAGSRSVDDVD